MNLGVIPARGGSKGIPRKNIRPLLGRPLIAWSIDAARESEYIDRFVVSTEDPEIAEVATREGAEVLWRPAELAQDDTTTVAVLQQVLKEIDSEVVVLLQPTSPVRVDNILDRAMERFLETGVDSLSTGYMVKAVEWGAMQNTPRQKIKGFFYDDGCVIINKAWVLRQGRWFGDTREPMIVEKHYNFEIDDEVDFWAVERIMDRLLQRSEK